VALICTFLNIYFLILLARILSSYFPPPTTPVLQRIVSILWALTEPILRPFRGLFPPLRVGDMALDLSSLIPFFILIILRGILC
jgi:YggT family protein